MEDDDDVIKKIVGKDQFKKLRKCFKQKIRKSLTKKMLMRRIPILTWLPKYNSKDAVGDFVAGLTVGLTVIPQALAYSSIAGLPPQVCRVIEKFSFSVRNPEKKKFFFPVWTLQFVFGCFDLHYFW